MHTDRSASNRPAIHRRAALTSARGAYLGTFQYEAHPEVSADGQTAFNDTPRRVIVRDAANNIVCDEVLPSDPPGTAIRMGATMESDILPSAMPEAVTTAP